MNPINMLQAKSTLSKLVEALEQGRESEIVIARNGRPVARLVPFQRHVTDKRIGVAKGRFEVPDDIDVDNPKIARLFKHGKP